MSAGHRRIVTVAVTTLVLLVLIVVGSTVQVPFVGLGPGPTLNTLGSAPGGKDIVEIRGAPTDPTSGHLNLTTVSVSDGLSLFQALGMWASGEYALQPRDTLYPPDQSTDEVQKQNQQQMSGSESTATAAALQFLHRPTKVDVMVAPSGPAGKVLRSGDQVRRVDGTEITTAEGMQKVIRAHRPGDTVGIDIVRGGAPQTVQVTLGSRPDDPKTTYIGVTPVVGNADPNLTIDYHVGDIGGPSAGMMLSLAVIDRLTPGELTHGRFIAGTGTISDDGQVGPIGGITHKMKAARDAGATEFLTPGDNCSEAKTDIPKGLTLVKVTTLGSAVAALNTIGTPAPVPHC